MILTDSKPARIATPARSRYNVSGGQSVAGGLIYADLTYKVRGAIFNVYNALGPGHKEPVYQKALAKELIFTKIAFQIETPLDVNYRGEKVGNYRPDFIIDNRLILEIKATEFMPKIFEQQLIRYLKTTNFKVGLLVNFGGAKLFIKRLIWTNPR